MSLFPRLYLISQETFFGTNPPKTVLSAGPVSQPEYFPHLGRKIMIESSGGIHDAADGGGYLAHAVLDRSALDSLRETNTGFLALVAARHAARPGVGALGLTAAATAAVATLDAGGRRAAAGCPYTLFNLRFEDGAFWSGVARNPGLAGPGSLSDEATFARTAVFLAWHLAQSSELTAALVLGMTIPVQRAWRRLPLSALDRAASDALPHLAARWGDHPRFWRQLRNAAAPLDPGRADSVRLLGLQLLAAEGIGALGARAEAGPGQ
jgi:hypothetical protein